MNGLERWWQYREKRLSQQWNLGLERISAVAEAGGIQPAAPLITVAGTNGKGSVCRYLEAMAIAAGLRVGVYTSPHLFRFQERIAFDALAISDGPLAQAFERVASLPGVEQLTVYEYDTLVAMQAFVGESLDLVVLEVGLGGRLDGVNIWDADLAIITSIDLDHQQWLGDTREAIGREKAGILRPGQTVVIGDREPPLSVLDQADKIGASVLRLGEDFDWRGEAGLFLPPLSGNQPWQRDNAAVALTAIRQLFGDALDHSAPVVDALSRAMPPGRCQRVDAEVPLWFDVGHNPQAARALSSALADQPVEGRTLAVFAALSDKDIERIVLIIAPQVDRWFLPDLQQARACKPGELLARVSSCGLLAPDLVSCENTDSAYAAARAQARPGDQIVVFGSFVTVSEAMAAAGLAL